MNRMHRETIIIPWQESWKKMFETEKAHIAEGMTAAGLEGNVYHVGSTSVKGMCARPIIDILFCPAQETSLEKCAAALERIGYTNLGECGRPGRLFLTKGDKENETFYLHLCDEDHQVAKDQKLFRFIQTHDETVFHEYMQLKRQLAEMFPHDRDVYRTVKGRFVEGVLSAYRLGEKTAAAKVVAGVGQEDKRVKYWIYQFEATEKAMADMEAYCQKNELTMDEFFQEAVRYWINLVENDPEGARKAAEEARNLKEEDVGVRLIRYYPVYKGETEARALKRTLAEEADAAVRREDEGAEADRRGNGK